MPDVVVPDNLMDASVADAPMDGRSDTFLRDARASAFDARGDVTGRDSNVHVAESGVLDASRDGAPPDRLDAPEDSVGDSLNPDAVSCPSGFRISENGCIDVNECESHNGGCGLASCTNAEGGYSCTCGAPYQQCGSNCTTCPNGDNVASTGCSAGSCVVTACAAGYYINRARNECTTEEAGIYGTAPLVLPPPPGLTRWSGDQSISISGDGTRLVIGLENNNRAAIYERTSDGAWLFRTTLSQPSWAIRFGASVSISRDGSTVAVGDPDGLAVGVQIYERRVGGTWDVVGNFRSPSGGAEFGLRVALSGDGDTLAVSDPERSTAQVYIYGRSPAGDWTFRNTLVRPGFDSFYFGSSIALADNGDHLIAADSGSIPTPGAVTIFSRQGDAWNAGTNVPGIRHGFGVGISGSADTLAIVEGSAFGLLYDRALSSRTSLIVPQNSIGATGPLALSRDGNTVVFAIRDNFSGSSNALLFRRSGEIWSDGFNLAPTLGVDYFGDAMTLSDDGSTLAVTGNGLVSVYSR